MGFDINKSITTKLDYQDVALIAVVFGEYQRLYEEKDPKADVFIRGKKLVDRLGVELYNVKRTESMEEMLIDFMVWYKNNVPIGTQKLSKEIVKDYLNRDKDGRST